MIFMWHTTECNNAWKGSCVTWRVFVHMPAWSMFLLLGSLTVSPDVLRISWLASLYLSEKWTMKTLFGFILLVVNLKKKLKTVPLQIIIRNRAAQWLKHIYTRQSVPVHKNDTPAQPLFSNSSSEMDFNSSAGEIFLYLLSNIIIPESGKQQWKCAVEWVLQVMILGSELCLSGSFLRCLHWSQADLKTGPPDDDGVITAQTPIRYLWDLVHVPSGPRKEIQLNFQNFKTSLTCLCLLYLTSLLWRDYQSVQLAFVAI